MTPGTTFIKECAHCQGRIAEATIGSGNTFGAKFWSDGKMEAPMLPDHPRLAKCPYCKAFVWLDDLKEAGRVEPFDDTPEQFKGARPYARLTLKDFHAFLKRGGLDAGKEHHARIRAWWSGNDARRKGKADKPLSAEEKKNLNALLPLVGRTANERIMKAEIHRELGEFDQALELLARPFGTKLHQAVAIIRTLAENRHSAVAEMKFE
jgi:hypothetical protein